MIRSKLTQYKESYFSVFSNSPVVFQQVINEFLFWGTFDLFGQDNTPIVWCILEYAFAIFSSSVVSVHRTEWD